MYWVALVCFFNIIYLSTRQENYIQISSSSKDSAVCTWGGGQTNMLQAQMLLHNLNCTWYTDGFTETPYPSHPVTNFGHLTQSRVLSILIYMLILFIKK